METEEVKVVTESKVRESGTVTAKSQEVESKPSTSTYEPRPCPFTPKGKIYNLIPRLVTPRPQSDSFPKTREPKFVPFEPYKAAVTPLFVSDSKMMRKVQKLKKNTNIDLNVLAEQIAENTKSEILNLDQFKVAPPREGMPNEWELKYNEMKVEKEYFEKQLKFQTQVNSELKNLLIAAVGEDLQTRVNVLTEDKLQLARALLDSSNNLTSHTEQIEYLVGQSEVWRSKFLASSLMVEELARWKTSLLEKNKHLITSSNEMLKTLSVVREMEIEMLKSLSFLIRKKPSLPSSNCIDLAKECVNIGQQLTLVNNSVGMPEDLHLEALDNLTNAEKLAIAALEITQQNLVTTDDPFKAVVGQAFPSMVAMREQREAMQGD